MITGNIGCKHTIALSAKAASPHLVINLSGVKLGDHVLTFVATINLVVYGGDIPIFIDTEYDTWDTWNMDPFTLKKVFELYLDVKVVAVAHLYDIPDKIDEIKDIFQRIMQFRLKLLRNH